MSLLQRPEDEPSAGTSEEEFLSDILNVLNEISGNLRYIIDLAERNR